MASFAAPPASAMLLASLAEPPSVSAGFGNFEYTGDYTAGQFLDVSETDWFASYVEDAYNYGLIRGKSPDKFDPGGLLTRSDAATLAARLRSVFLMGTADFTEYVPAFSSYVGSAVPITRAGFAELVYSALPPEAFAIINEINNFGICDVPHDAGYRDAVYALYRSGVLSGSDRFGTFFPNANITRAEACAVMVRLADPYSRVSFSIASKIPAELIFQRNCDAVFMIETFDADGKSIRTSSGFFISESGLAVSNRHVIDGAVSADITLYSGDVMKMKGVRAISEEFNLIIFELEAAAGSDVGFGEDAGSGAAGETIANAGLGSAAGSDANTGSGSVAGSGANTVPGPAGAGRSFLIIGDSDMLETGNDVYTIGSPISYINSMSAGIVSNVNREVGNEQLIQFTAPISFGSGGSPLLNTLGQVVGVTSSSFSYGQNLNLAVPIKHLLSLELGELMSLESLLLPDVDPDMP